MPFYPPEKRAQGFDVVRYRRRCGEPLGCFGGWAGSRTRRETGWLGSSSFCSALLGGSRHLTASMHRPLELGILATSWLLWHLGWHAIYQQPNPTAKTHQRPFPLPYPQSPCGDSSSPCGKKPFHTPTPNSRPAGPATQQGDEPPPDRLRAGARPSTCEDGPSKRAAGVGQGPYPFKPRLLLSSC